MKTKLSSVDRAYITIKNMISDRALLPGQQLVESNISAQCGMSRTPVREAMRLLATEGLVEALPNRGVFVRQVNREEVVMAYEAAAALEGMAGELCVERLIQGELTLEDLDILETYVSAMEGIIAAKQVDGWMDQDRLFHTKILELSGNKILSNQRRDIIAQVEMIGWFVPPSTVEQREWFCRDHRNILTSLQQMDAERVNYHGRLHRKRARALIWRTSLDLEV